MHCSLDIRMSLIGNRVKVETIPAFLFTQVSLGGERALEIGCGTGDIVRQLAPYFDSVFGLDVRKREEWTRAAGLQASFLSGSGENLPMMDSCFDQVFFIASLHHIPGDGKKSALKEAYRVLKPGGIAISIEPVTDCTYYRITRLMEEETAIRKEAYEALMQHEALGFSMDLETDFYMERSMDDYMRCMDLFFQGSAEERHQILDRSRAILLDLAQKDGCNPSAFRFQSACRMNVLKKLQ